MPASMLSVAIVLLFRDRTGSFAAAGVAVGAFVLTSAAANPLQGRLVDRVGQPRILAACACGQAAALVGLVLAAKAGLPEDALIALAGAAGAMQPPATACVRAIWRELTEDDDLRTAAYTLDSTAIEVSWVVGPLIVVAVVALSSSSGAVLASAATSLVGASVLATSPHARQWQKRDSRARGHALSSSGLRRVLVSIGLTGLWWGFLQVGVPALAVQLGSKSASGALLALVSLGGVAGGIVYGAIGPGLSLAARHVLLAGLLAVLTVPLALANTFALAVPLAFVAGLALPPLVACQNTQVGSHARHGTVAEAFSWTSTASSTGTAVGATAAGVLIASSGPMGALLAACSVGGIAVLYAVATHRGESVPVALGDGT